MQAESESTKERILCAAIEAFAAADYEGTSIRDVARAAGVSLPVIYYYFQSKEGLYDYVMRHCRLSYIQRVKAALQEAEGGLRAKLEAIVRARQALMKDDPSLVLLLIREQFGIDEWMETPQEISPTLSVTFEFVDEMLKDGVRAKEIPAQDGESAAWALVGLMGIFDLRILNRGTPAPAAEIDRIVQFALTGLNYSPAGVPAAAEVE
jgi:TetR/AcrR family transcriptional regulator